MEGKRDGIKDLRLFKQKHRGELPIEYVKLNLIKLKHLYSIIEYIECDKELV